MSNHSAAHSALVNDLLIALTVLPSSTWYKNNTGQAITRTGAIIRFGFPGSGDIMGCYWGRAVAIDAKTGTGRQNDAQEKFQVNWEKAGGLYVIARCVPSTISVVLAIRAFAA